MPVVYCRSVCLGLLLALSTAAYYNVNILLKHRKKRSSGGSIPSRVQMMAVGCRRAFAARTAVTWFERHLVADIFCEPHETKTLIEIPPYYIDTLLFAMSTELKSDILNRLSWGRSESYRKRSLALSRKELWPRSRALKWDTEPTLVSIFENLRSLNCMGLADFFQRKLVLCTLYFVLHRL
jgi:hypothetical protein